MEQKSIPNVVVFGSTGSGKSSVVNMLDGSSHAEVSNAARGMTFSNTCYEKLINGEVFNVVDTVGLNEGMRGTVSPREAIEGLYNLTLQLNDGISLLVLIMRAPRITAVEQQNYQMFCDILCHKQVPIVIIVTGLEYEQNMDDWWPANEKAFDLYGMYFTGYACITATSGMSNGEELWGPAYEESKVKVQKLISRSVSPVPWKVSHISWFYTSVQGSLNIWANVFGCKPRFLAPELDAALASYGALLGQDVVTVRNTAGRSGAAEAPRIIVFGNSHTENNFIVNMLNGNSQANAANSPRPTPNNIRSTTIRDLTFDIYETGFSNESATLHVVEELFHLTSQLTVGVNLLVLVVRAPADGAVALQNYKMLFESLLNKQVPIVIVVTGVESQQNTDEWWPANRVAFDEHGMHFHGNTCITATPEDKSEWNESKEKLEELIYTSYRRVPWKMPHNSGFIAILRSYLSPWLPIIFKPKVLAPNLYNSLISYGGFSVKDALRESNKIASSFIGL